MESQKVEAGNSPRIRSPADKMGVEGTGALSHQASPYRAGSVETKGRGGCGLLSRTSAEVRCGEKSGSHLIVSCYRSISCARSGAGKPGPQIGSSTAIPYLVTRSRISIP